MKDRLMRALSMAPVIDPDNQEQLHVRVRKIIVRMEAHGEDPLTKMRMCQSYLADRICDMKRTHGKKSWIMQNTNPKKIGSYAWLMYMLDQTTKIVSILVDRKLQEALKI